MKLSAELRLNGESVARSQISGLRKSAAQSGQLILRLDPYRRVEFNPALGHFLQVEIELEPEPKDYEDVP